MTKDNYSAWVTASKLPKNKSTRAKYKASKLVREELSKAKDARRTSCFFSTNAGDSSNSSNSSGGDWQLKWDKWMKAWLGWYQPSSADDFKSNIKLPETTGRIESLMHKIRRVNFGWLAEPNSPEDENVARIAAPILDYIFYDSKLSQSTATWAKEALIYGSGFARLVYIKDIRELRFPKTSDISQDEAKDVEKGKVVFKPKEKVTKFEGFQLIPIPIEEVYVNPGARKMHGHSYAASKFMWERIVDFDEFKAMFSNDPMASDVDKVKPASQYGKEDEPFFKKPESIGKDGVLLVDYEDPYNDRYIVIANGIVIKDQPLPYRHKEGTFHKIDCIENPNQFYGIGIPAFLENIQAAAEITLNLMIDKMYRSMNVRYAIDGSIYGEFANMYQRPENALIPISTMDGTPMQSKIMPLQTETVDFDGYRILDKLQQYASMATQVDLSQMNLQNPDRTATATSLSRELVDIMVASILDNMANTFVDVGRQMWTIVQEKWSVPKIVEVIGEDGQEKIKKEVYKNIKLKGMEVEMAEDGTVSLNKTDQKYSFFEVSEGLLKTENNLDIRIAPDTIEVMSKTLRRQKTMELYAQMMPNAVDPTDKEKLKMHPLPLYDARVLAKRLVNDGLGGDDDVLLSADFDNTTEVAEAQQNVAAIFQGEIVNGVPGRSDAYIEYITYVLRNLNQEQENLAKEMSELEEVIPPTIDPMTGQEFPGQLPQGIIDLFENRREIQVNLASHLEQSRLPAYASDIDALMGAQPPQPEPQQANIPMPQQMSQADILPNFGGSQ